MEKSINNSGGSGFVFKELQLKSQNPKTGNQTLKFRFKRSRIEEIKGLKFEAKIHEILEIPSR